MIGTPVRDRGGHEAAAAEPLQLVALAERLADALEALGPHPDELAGDSIRSASSLQARVRAALAGQLADDRHLEDEVGAERTQVAAGVVVVHRRHRHQPVERHGAGVVGDDQRAALGGDVLQAAHLDPEPLLRERPQRGMKKRSVSSAVEAELVDLVVAGQPAAQERQELGEACAPSPRRRSPARRPGERREPVARPGCRRTRRRAPPVGSSDAAGRALGGSATGSSPARLVARRAAPASGAGLGGVGAGRLLGAPVARRRGRVRAASTPRPGRPRVPAGARGSPIGITSASGTLCPRCRGRPRSDPLGRGRRGRGQQPRADSDAEVGERLRGGVRRLEAELGRASGWCRARGRRSGSRSCSGRSPPARGRAAWPRRGDRRRRRGIGIDGAPEPADRPGDSSSTPSPATLKVPWTRSTRRVAQHREQVVLVEELQPRVEAEHASGRPASRK